MNKINGTHVQAVTARRSWLSLRSYGACGTLKQTTHTGLHISRALELLCTI